MSISRFLRSLLQPKFMSTRGIVLGGIGVLLLAAIMSLAGMQGRPKRQRTVIPTPTNQRLNVRTTPADRQIQKAEARIKSNPSSAEAYGLLASAYMQKARETGDFSFNTRAESALTREKVLMQFENTNRSDRVKTLWMKQEEMFKQSTRPIITEPGAQRPPPTLVLKWFA